MEIKREGFCEDEVLREQGIEVCGMGCVKWN